MQWSDGSYMVTGIHHWDLLMIGRLEQLKPYWSSLSVSESSLYSFESVQKAHDHFCFFSFV